MISLLSKGRDSKLVEASIDTFDLQVLQIILLESLDIRSKLCPKTEHDKLGLVEVFISRFLVWDYQLRKLDFKSRQKAYFFDEMHKNNKLVF